jgi:hypothetical protein
MMSGALLQFAGSLLAVGLLVAMVHWAGFSRTARLRDEAEAREIARLAPGGFSPQHIALDREGRAALAADAAGHFVLLRAHGAMFVAEPVSRAQIRGDGDALVVASAGGTVTLSIGVDAARWRERKGAA